MFLIFNRNFFQGQTNEFVETEFDLHEGKKKKLP